MIRSPIHVWPDNSDHRRIASGAALIAAVLLAAKLFAVAREAAIAWRYGVSELVDAYQLALTITTWLPMLLVSVLTVVLVPRFVALRGKPNDYNGFVRELNGSVVLVALAVAVGAFAAAPFAARFFAAGLGSETVSNTSLVAAYLSPVAFMIVVGGYFSARLQAKERFLFGATEALPPAALAVAVIALPAAAGVAPLIWGTLVGFGLQVVALVAMTRTADPPIGTIRFRHRSIEWNSLYGGMLLMSSGQLLLTSVIPIDQLFASRLGEGAIATLGYANRIISLITGFGVVVMSRALLPVLSSSVAQGNDDSARKIVVRWSIIMFCAALAGSVVGWLLAPIAVSLLFERGAFDSVATQRVSDAVRYGLIQIAPFFAGVALVQWYAAAGRFRFLLLITASALALKLVLNALLAQVLGIPGIMISTAAMYLLTTIFMAAPIAKALSRVPSAH